MFFRPFDGIGQIRYRKLAHSLSVVRIESLGLQRGRATAVVFDTSNKMAITENVTASSANARWADPNHHEYTRVE